MLQQNNFFFCKHLWLSKLHWFEVLEHSTLLVFLSITQQRGILNPFFFFPATISLSQYSKRILKYDAECQSTLNG